MLQTSDLIGKPFRDGAMGPDAWSCWGVAVELFRRYGVELPDYLAECVTVAAGVGEKRKQWVRCSGEIPVPALIVFTTAGICDHLGVYLGNGWFIHAHESSGVQKCRTDHPFWKKRIEGYYVPGWLNETDFCQKPDHS